MNKTFWRDTYRPPRLFVVDARASFVLLPALLHIRLWTLATALSVFVLLYYFEKRRQVSVASAARMCRCWLVTKLSSPQRPARLLTKVGRPVDYAPRNF